VAAQPALRNGAKAVRRHREEARPRDRLRQRNRLLAALLGGIAALVLVTAFSVVLLLHYAEIHHLYAIR
jgi:hypothetical protein